MTTSLEQMQTRLSVQSRADEISALRMETAPIRQPIAEPINQHLDPPSERSQIASNRLSNVEKQIDSLIERAEFDLRFLLTVGLLTVEWHLWLESIEPDTPLYRDLCKGFQTLQGIAAAAVTR